MHATRILFSSLALALTAGSGCQPTAELGTSEHALTALGSAADTPGDGSDTPTDPGGGSGTPTDPGGGYGGSGYGSDGGGSGTDPGGGSGAEPGDGSGSDFLVARFCGDAEDEADLKSELALERSEAEVARAHSLRHAGRIAELEADAALNKASIGRLPTKKKLTYQIAANSIAGMLELSAIKNLARGRAVKATSTANTCLTGTAGEVKLAVASSAGTVWRPPSMATVGNSAMKLGAGMWIQSVNDDGVQRIPVIGVVAAIGEAGAQLVTIDDVRQSMVDFGTVLDKAIEMEKTEKAKWDKEVDAHDAKVEELKQKLQKLKERPGDDEAGEADHDEFELVETEITDIGPFL